MYAVDDTHYSFICIKCNIQDVLQDIMQDVQDPHELLHAEQPLEQLQEQFAATTLTPAPTNLAFSDFIKF